MSKVITAAVEKLNDRISSFTATAKFVVQDEGAIMIDSSGVHAGDDDADVTLIASREVFEGILDGSVNPATAFMTGKLRVEGNMGIAMQLGQALS